MLILRWEAERDIKEIYEWYECRRLNLGREFFSEIEVKLENIECNPNLYAKIYKDVRRALCGRFPYSIYFIEANGSVVIIGVFHQRRNPSVWRMRV